MNEIKNINQLRDVLADSLKQVKDGSSTAATANAVANVAGKILSSVKLELEYNKMVGATPHIDFINTVKKKITSIEHKKQNKTK